MRPMGVNRCVVSEQQVGDVLIAAVGGRMQRCHLRGRHCVGVRSIAQQPLCDLILVVGHSNMQLCEACEATSTELTARRDAFDLRLDGRPHLRRQLFDDTFYLRLLVLAHLRLHDKRVCFGAVRPTTKNVTK